MPLIFQYGSNCDLTRFQGRLRERVDDIGRAETTADYDIAFDVWSQGNGCAASDLVETPGRRAHGVLYRISDVDFERLKRIEGDHYEPRPISVRNQVGEEVEATTFLVVPNDRRQGLWTSADYVGYIVRGLRTHDVPEAYVQHVIDVAIDTNRRAAQAADEQSRLIESLRTPS